ncbi:MAG TPA: phytanoyl-CoA dioxygenase family protein [Abditibacteriaceae bacterium]
MQNLLSPPQLTDEQLGLLPTNEDVAFYREHGYYVSKKIFSDEEIDAALSGSEAFYNCELHEPEPHILEKLDALGWSRPKGEYSGLRKHDYSSFWRRELGHLVRHALLGGIAARLTGSPEVRLWHDQLLYKPTDSPDKKANVGWHTDRGYWKTCSSHNMVTAWIPFHDCTEEMGTITMIDGSLHWPDNTNKLDFFSNDLDGLEKEFVTGGRRVLKVPVNLQKGQVSFHHSLTIHGSGPNRSNAPRRSIAVHLQDKDNHWQEFRMKQGRLATHANDNLVRQFDGHPDYFDPDFCPVLWRQQT